MPTGNWTEYVQMLTPAHTLRPFQCRNLCTLSLKREKLKWQMVSLLKEALDFAMGDLAEESHLSSRSFDKLASFWNEFMADERAPLPDEARSASPSGSRPCSSRQAPKSPPHRFGGRMSKLQQLFVGLFDDHLHLSKDLFDELL